MTTSITVLDGNKVTQEIAVESRSGVFTTHSALEIDGAVVSAANLVPMRLYNGSTGLDYSPNPPVALDGYVEVTIVPTDSTRNSIEVQNQDVDPIQLIRSSDGEAFDSSILLNPGEIWSSLTFQGALIIYGSTVDAQVSAYTD